MNGNAKHERIPVGTKVTVKPMESICEYLHGVSGVIVETEIQHSEGKSLAVLSEPAKRSHHTDDTWPAMTTLWVGPSQIEPF